MRILGVHCYHRHRRDADLSFDAETELLESHGHCVFRLTRHPEDFTKPGIASHVLPTLWNRQASEDLVDRIHRHRIEIVHFHRTFPAISPAAIRAAHDAGAITVMSLYDMRLGCATGVCYRDAAPCTECLTRIAPISSVVHGCFRGSRWKSGVVAAQTMLHRQRKTYSTHVDVAITPTLRMKRLIEESGIPIAKMEVKPHFVSSSLPPGAGAGGYALFVGRLSDSSGLVCLLRAWSEMPHRLELRIIGDGDLSHLVQPPPPGVTYLGKLNPEAISEAMAHAALLICPFEGADGLGQTAILAFSRGTPIVCADTSVPAEWVNSSTGATFRAGDAEDLAGVVTRMFGDAALRTTMRQAARAEFETNHTAAANYAQLRRIYEDAVARRGKSLQIFRQDAATAVRLDALGRRISFGSATCRVAKQE